MFGLRANRHRSLAQIGGLMRTPFGTRVVDTLARTKNLSGTGAPS